MSDTEINFEFACRDDCLDHMVPSDLRKIIAERDRLMNENPTEPLSKAFKKDPDFAWSWHCNIACLLLDEGVDHAAANKRAAGFMKLAFGVSGYEPKEDN